MKGASRPGRPEPLGATLVSGGVNFALYSESAEGVELALFKRPDDDPAAVVELTRGGRHIWTAFVPGLEAGQLYGYRVRGPFVPERGLRFNPAKLLVDPYAKALSGAALNTGNLLLSYDPLSAARDKSLDRRPNHRVVPKSVVVDDAFDWQGDAFPDLPLESLVIYEVHAKGFTAHPSSGVAHPGTYLGFIEKIPYLKSLGVNAVELLPVHAFFIEDFLRERGLTNYWGYNTLSFFAPEPGYGTGRSAACEVAEFKTLVRELHKAGIEVILDVVYNHTCEGSELGPTLSLRGVDNPTYYLLTGPQGEGGRYYMNYTGCGNSLNAAHPQAVRLIMDSLRYWASVMRVDGFRFDLASVLGREGGDFRRASSFFDAASQDPVLRRVKLIAEPWDCGTYQVGNFPLDWSEWNGAFRDCMRRFTKGEPGMLPELGRRLSGSADLFGDDGRCAANSINFLTCHDGFTLWDLVSYNGKHNEANGEGNRDGSDDNNSWNCGAEGETSDPAVLELRRRLARNHVCQLLFACGTPMVLGGDEFLRTQRGNNNAYCQDNPLSWFDWDRARENSGFTDFFRAALALTRRFPVLQRRRFFGGADPDGDGIPDLSWFGPDGGPPAWGDPQARTLCLMLDGEEPSADGLDYALFMVLNADHNLLPVRLPPAPRGPWRRLLDTWSPDGAAGEVVLAPQDVYLANPRSVVLLLSGVSPAGAPTRRA